MFPLKKTQLYKTIKMKAPNGEFGDVNTVDMQEYEALGWVIADEVIETIDSATPRARRRNKNEPADEVAETVDDQSSDEEESKG